MIVRNDILWIEREKKQNENTDKLFEVLVSDFENVAKAIQLNSFLKGKSVKYNLYLSDLKNEELPKTETKNYGSQRGMKNCRVNCILQVHHPH